MTEVIMPKMGDGMEEGVLVRWLRALGDTVEPGDIIAEIETDKANVELPVEAGGVIVAIAVPEGATVPVGAVIARLGTKDELAAGAATTPKAPETSDALVEPAPTPSKEKPASTSEASSVPVAPVATAETKTPRTSDRVLASPLARRLAADLGVNLADVRGTGPGGRIVERDVRAAAEAQASSKPRPVESQIPAAAQPVSRMRRVIAERTTQAKQQVPHFYVTVRIDVEELAALRQRMNQDADEASRISLGDFVMKACGLALPRHPAVNAHFTEQGIVMSPEAHIAFAVALPDGLVMPVIRNCESKPLRVIAREVRESATQARSGRLSPDQLNGGTFAISNLGMYGVEEFSAIISQPMTAILAVSAAERQVVVLPDGQMAPRLQMRVTLSADHRALDGAVAAQFLQTLRSYLEQPYSLVS